MSEEAYYELDGRRCCGIMTYFLNSCFIRMPYLGLNVTYNIGSVPTASINRFYCRFSIESSLAVNAISWSDKCAIASSFILSRSLIAWFSCSNSSTLVCISAFPIGEHSRMSGKVQSCVSLEDLIISSIRR